MSNKSEATFHGRVQTGLPDDSDIEIDAKRGAVQQQAQEDVEAETVGDWAGHTPAIDAEIAAGQDHLEADRFYAEMHRAAIEDGIRSLVTISGENSRDHGFHDDWPTIESEFDRMPGHDRQIGLAITEKLALIHEEISEALGEIRNGHDPLEIYFVDKKSANPTEAIYSEQQHVDGVPQFKPEGFLVELADAAIRIADLVYLVGGRGEFIKALEVKHSYNATRPFKHGRKF